ncbi:MAG: dTDP-glucose 4,6-dehydratase [Acidimicrobiales bacterium]
MKLLVTGGAGFIGSNFVRHRLDNNPEDRITVLDKMTYAGHPENLAGLPAGRFSLVEADICDPEAVNRALDGCGAIVNFAAESHVDRSIEAPGEFITTDVYGTYVLLEAAREAGIRHLQISTDEVYGSIDEGSFTETSPLDPSSPYSASKAGGDLVVSAFKQTYGADSLIVRASNNYGPQQHPEKLIPLAVLNAMHGDAIPVYGDGMQVRNWLFVRDFCTAIETVLEKGEAGQVYNVGGPDELPNIEVVRRILELAGRDESQIEYVSDRLGHDVRYSLASDKVEGLDWEAAVTFDEGIERTFNWYRDNRKWWEALRSGEYRDYYLRQYGTELADSGSGAGPAGGGAGGSEPAA